MRRTKSFFKEMMECKDVIQRNKDKEAARVWLSVQTFVESGCYTSYRRAGELTRLMLQGYKDAYISKYMSIEEQTVRYYRMKLSNSLYSMFGEGFFILLADYKRNRDEVTARVTSVNYIFLHSVDFLPNEVLVLLNNSSVVASDDFSLSDCKRELSFLNRYCMQSMRDDFKRLDKVKLDYLIRILDGLVGTPTDRYKVLSLVANLSDKEILELTKSIYGTKQGQITPTDISSELAKEDLDGSDVRVSSDDAVGAVETKLSILDDKLGSDSIGSDGIPSIDDTEVTEGYNPLETADIQPVEVMDDTAWEDM